MVPTLLSWTGSTVVHDIKGETWTLTSGWRARFSHCLRFDPTDPLSCRFNPLLEVRKGTHEVHDVQNIADILVDPEGAREQRDHWEKTAHALLTGLRGLPVLRYGFPRDQRRRRRSLQVDWKSVV